MNFWQSWSAPCLKELQRLQGLLQRGRENGQKAPFIVAFHGGADARGLDEIRKRLGVLFALVPDPEHRVARMFGVRCWPTTIALNPNGDVEHIQMGVSHEHSGAKAY
jgi:thiol-disulfide isomerase/thioredoxin